MRERLAIALLLASATADASAQEAISIRFLDGANARLDPARDSALPTLHVPNDDTLPRAITWAATADARDLRIEIVDPDATALDVVVEVIDPRGARRDALERVTLERGGDGSFRSPHLRLVASEIDRAAPGVTDRLLRVALGDRIRVTHRGATAELPVGRAAGEEHPRAILTGTLRIRIVRNARGAMPPIGSDDASAIAIAREQVAIANEIWSQCAIRFGDPPATDVAIVDPPPPWTIAVGDVDGLPAAGGGTIRLRVDGRPIAPVTTRAGARPIVTALAVAAAIRSRGFAARVFENERAESGVGRSADVVVRRRDGFPASIAIEEESDARQRIALGAVELGDGLSEFDNMTALTGTLEERALVRAVADEDDSTIDVIVVGELSGRTREAEAFLEAESAGAPGSIVNAVILAREALARGRTSFTVAHEVGHVILDQAIHPDHLGSDRPWLLMDSNASDGTILGPIRLTEDACRRARERSGPRARPALLR